LKRLNGLDKLEGLEGLKGLEKSLIDEWKFYKKIPLSYPFRPLGLKG
jgi:hypothetical protein